MRRIESAFAVSEDGVTWLEAKDCGQSLKVQKSKKTNSLLELPRGTQAC